MTSASAVAVCDLRRYTSVYMPLPLAFSEIWPGSLRGSVSVPKTLAKTSLVFVVVDK